MRCQFLVRVRSDDEAAVVGRETPTSSCRGRSVYVAHDSSRD